MKKFYVLSVMMLFAFAAMAQKQVGTANMMPKSMINDVKSIDTLLPGNLPNLTTYNFVCYGSQNGGYLLGANGYGDQSKGQVYAVLTPYAIEGALYWFGAKEVLSGGSVIFEVRNMDGTAGTTSAGANQPCPNTLLGTAVTTPTANVDTSSYLSGAHVVTFASPISVSTDYFIGFNMSSIGTDTIGLVSTEDGQGGGLELVWEQWSPSGWYTLQGAGWGGGTFDVDAMIMPIVNTGSGIENYGFINGMKFDVNPNPASDFAQMTYELERNSNNVSIRILDANGRVVSTIEQGARSAGVHNLSIDVTTFESGNYFVILTSNTQNLVKRIMVAK